MREIDRDMKKVEREENKIKKEIKKEAKLNGNSPSVKILAKSIVKSQKQREKMMITKTQINSVSLTLKQQYANMKVTKVVGKSAMIMKHMNNMINTKQMNDVMKAMSKEMMKAGIMEEMMDDVFEDIADEDEDELVDEEVNKVLEDLIPDFGEVGTIKGGLPKKKEEVQEKKVDTETDEMAARLAALG